MQQFGKDLHVPLSCVCIIPRCDCKAELKFICDRLTHKQPIMHAKTYCRHEDANTCMHTDMNTSTPPVHTHAEQALPLGWSLLLSWCFLSSLSGSWWLRAEDRASRLAVPAPGGRGGCRPAGCGVSGTGMAWPWERC